MLDRTTQPKPGLADKIQWIEASAHTMDNGCDLYTVHAGDQEVLRFELIFPKGVGDTANAPTAIASHMLMDSGTNKKDSKTIAEAFDRLGSYFAVESGADFRSLTVFSMRSAFTKTLDVLKEVLEEAAFPEQEVMLWKQRNMEQLKVSREKVSWLSRIHFNETLFGKNHAYGYYMDEDDFNRVHAEDLRRYHQESTLTESCMMMLSGKIGKAEIQAVNRVFGKSKRTAGVPISSALDIIPSAPTKKHFPKSDAMQCGLRIGRVMMTKHHPDYIPFQMANTVLGGYFGSRLMSNIREDKGYTYGIGSAIIPHIRTGYFFITTEVGKDVCASALEEIYKELSRLAQDPIPAAEINLVRNYLLGEFQRNLDGPFALADRFKNLKLYGLGYDYLNNYLDYLNNFSAQNVTEMAQKYLSPSEMTEIVAGG